mmetsp:Transcript_20962/g.37346  ORF Transcript_20962/g.37346 Transcript_20962/m.37346 type:complete len:630 (+) Transcript_20962:422-2311(+)
MRCLLFDRNAALGHVRAVPWHHFNAVDNRTHAETESAACAILGHNFCDVCERVESDRLVAVVVTRHIALAAVNAQVLVDLSDHVLLLAQLVPRADTRHGSTYDVVDFWHVTGELGTGASTVILGRDGELLLLTLLGLDVFLFLLIRAEVGQICLGRLGFDPGVLLRRLDRSTLAVPLTEVVARLEVQSRLEAGDVVVDDGVVLVLHSTADLHARGTSMEELHAHSRAVAASGRENREARQRLGDGRDSPQCHRADGVTGDTSVGCAGLLSDLRPGLSFAVEVHKSRDGVDRSHSVGSSGLGAGGDDDDVGDVRGHLGEDGHVDPLSVRTRPKGHAFDPAANILNVVGVLAASQTHALLAHAVRAGHIELESIGSGFAGSLGKCCPVFLVVASHDGGDEHVLLGREVPLQLANGLLPVGLRLLRDQFDVEEGALAGSVELSGGSSPHDARRHVGHDVLVPSVSLGDSEAPAGFERAADHRRGGGRRRRGEAEGVGQAEAFADVHAEVDCIDFGAEAWHFLVLGNRESLESLQVVVHRPGGELAVCCSFDCEAGDSSQVATDEHRRVGSALGVGVDDRESPFVQIDDLRERVFHGARGELTAERRDDCAGLHRARAGGLAVSALLSRLELN